MTTLKKLYSSGEMPDSAYFISDCTAYCYLSNVDKYAIRGKNLIIGSSELIVNKILGIDTQRLETVVTPCTGTIKKITSEKFLSGLNTFSFIINTSTVLARQVLETNKILNNNLNNLHENDKLIQDLSVKFYSITEDLAAEYYRRKLPWINDITKKYYNTITYKRGEAFSKSIDSITITPSTELSKNMIEFHRGTSICEENTSGEEMYILQSGAIDVEIHGNKVATIDEKGTVIGEMALLLNEKRTATLRAKNNTVISIIKKDELKKTVEQQPDLLQKIAIALAQRQYYNLLKIGTVNQSLIEKDLDEEEDGEKKALKIEKIKSEVSKLKSEISDAAYKKDADFLRDIISKYE